MTRQGYKTRVLVLTFSRIPLVLCFAGFAILSALRDAPVLGIVAFALLILSAVTDAVDGYLARKWNVCSQLGAFADPLADKMFYLVALPVLLFLAMHMGQTTHGIVLLVLSILFLLRDQWVSFLRSIGAVYEADVRANWSGKLRTAVSFPIICLVYGYLVWFSFLPLVILLGIETICILINLISIIVYTREYWPYLRLALERNTGRAG
jgi:CDP-diacylglycerol--glycerol-3-phosphate 3-phosphatidyltransferase